MRISPIGSNSFTGQVKRSLCYDYSSVPYRCPKKREVTKDEWLDTYKEAHDRITRQQEYAMELDRFMHSDEITKEVAKLPEGVDIVVCHNYNEDYFAEPTRYKGLHLSVSDYKPFHEKELAETNDIDNRKVHNLAHCWMQNDDGTIDKEEIVGWIGRLQRYFNVK